MFGKRSEAVTTKVKSAPAPSPASTAKVESAAQPSTEAPRRRNDEPSEEYY